MLYNGMTVWPLHYITIRSASLLFPPFPRLPVSRWHGHQNRTAHTILHRRYVNRLFRGVNRLLEDSVNDFTYSMYTVGEVGLRLDYVQHYSYRLYLSPSSSSSFLEGGGGLHSGEGLGDASKGV